MTRVLIVGIDPDEVDFSDPALPPGLNADMIRRGVAASLQQLGDAGYDVEHFYISADPKSLSPLADKLAGAPFDCVTIGGGVRLPPSNLGLFEAVLNTIGRANPTPAIGLVSRPDEAPQAVARALAQP